MSERLDGNALAGVAFELFGREMTLAACVCRSCGVESRVGELHVYVAAGLVARCPACGAVLVKVVEGRGRTWLDLGGLGTLEVPGGAAPPSR